MNDTTPENINLYLNDAAKYYLGDTAKWAKFLAIMGFVGCGILVLIGLFFSLFMSTMGKFSSSEMPFSGFGLIYVALAALYFFPSLYLFQFAKNAKLALQTEDSDLLATAIDKHHSAFKFIGILTATVLGLYALIFIFVIVGFGIGMNA